MKAKVLQFHRVVRFAGIETLQQEKNMHYVMIMPEPLTAA